MRTTTTTLTAASLTLLLTGCGSVMTLTEPPTDCTNTNPNITVEYGPGRLAMTNECVKLEAGDPVMFTFRRISATTPVADTVRTKFRGIGRRWLDKEVSGEVGTITIPVPSDARGRAAVKAYKFEVHVSDVGILDPRIVVQ